MPREEGAEMLDAWSETQLRDICYHWDTAYDISVIDGVWTARSLGPIVGNPLQAARPDLLRQMIRSDYGKRPSAPDKPAR